MNHGRFAFICLLSCLSLRAAAQNSPATTPATAPIEFTWQEPDHPSAIYHVKDDARLTVIAANISGQPADISGEILFGPRSPGEFKPLSVTPIAAASLAPGARVRIPLAVTFGAAGGYELRFQQGDATAVIDGPGAHPGDWKLQCIFAPRAVAGATSRAAATAPPTRGAAASLDSPWITLLPRYAATTPGLLGDYVQQTSVHRFLIDERFAYDPAANVGLGFGASTGASAKQFDALLAEAAKAKAQFALRVAVPLDTDPATVLKSIDAFKKYLDDGVRRSKGTLTAIAIVPDAPRGAALSDARKSLFHSYYVAGHDAAKKADKTITLLGAGSAAWTAEIFPARDPKLAALDALALTDASFEPLIAATLLGDRNMPLEVLPPMPAEAGSPVAWPSAAAALAAKATIVPVPPPEFDNGVTAHLLDGATFTQRLRLMQPTKDPAHPAISSVPFIAIFQGEGYSVAAIAGPGAGTDLDGLFPGLTLAPARVTAAKPDENIPPDPNLEVSDDTHAMRVVDAAGQPVDCRVGDSLYVPAGDRPAYLLEAGSADDLAGSLGPSVPHHLPLFEVRAALDRPQTLKVTLRNVTARELSGTLAVAAPADPAQAALLQDVPAIAPGKTADFQFDLPDGLFSGDPPPAGRSFELLITTTGTKATLQRSSIVVHP